MQRSAEAAKIADADTFLAALPAGYQTPLSRRFTGGHELSGGQWQKVAIARAFFYRSAPKLMIHEPTAALDARARHPSRSPRCTRYCGGAAP